MEASSHVASTCVHVLGNPQTQRREKQPSLLRIILTRPPITSVLLLDALDNDELRAAATSASQNTARAYWEAASSSGSADAVTGTLPLGHIPHWVTDCEANYRVPYVDPHLPLSPAISSEIKAVIALEPASTTHPYDSQQLVSYPTRTLVSHVPLLSFLIRLQHLTDSVSCESSSCPSCLLRGNTQDIITHYPRNPHIVPRPH